MKRKLIRGILLLLLVAVAAMSAVTAFAADVGDTFTVDDLNYTITGLSPNTVSVSGYSGGADSIVIPAVVTDPGSGGLDYGVTAIGVRAFYQCSGLTSVAIPDSVKIIDEFAFYYCDGLASVTIPGSVTTIRTHAFFNCGSLTSLTIPGSVEIIGGSAFEDCKSLTSVTIEGDAVTIGGYVFQNCFKLTSATFGGGPPATTGDCIFHVSGLVNSNLTVYYPASKTAAWEAEFLDGTFQGHLMAAWDDSHQTPPPTRYSSGGRAPLGDIPDSAFRWDGRRTLTITLDGLVPSELDRVLWDGAETTAYKVYAGSVIIEFDQAFIAAHPPGEHTVRVQFTEYSGTFRVTVGSANPNTGRIEPAPPAGAAVLLAGGLLLVGAYRKHVR